MNKNTTPLMEREINDLLQTLNELAKIGRFRRFSAYGLKIVAGGSGFLIALDVLSAQNKWLGGAVLLAVFIDGVFSNHERLIGELDASYTAKLRRRQITAEHNRGLAPLITQMQEHTSDTPEYKTALSKKNQLERTTHKLLLQTVTAIETALAKLDLTALKNLSLEAERMSINK